MYNKLYLFKEDTSKIDLINNNEDKLIAVLDDMATSAIINYNLDSNHSITITLDSELANGIINKVGKKQIIKAKTLEDDYDYFVVSGIDKSLDSLEIVAIHWITETINNTFIIDSKPRDINANLALKHLRENSEEYKLRKQHILDLETNGNIDTLASFNVFQESFGNYLATLQELYSSEVSKKEFNLSLMDFVGSKIPRYNVEYGKNLISSTQSEEYNVISGVLGKGYDGIHADIQYSNKILSGVTITKEYKVRVREEDEEIDEDYEWYDTLEQAQERLGYLARQEFELNKIDEPTVTFDISYLDLATVEESNITEKTYLSVGDVVNCTITKYNLDINVRVQEFNYNVLSEEIEDDVTLSNANVGSLKIPTLNSINKEVESKPSFDEVTSMTKQESTNIINAGMKNSYVVVRKNELLVMDSQKVENAVNVWRWNKNGLMFSNSGYEGTYQMGMRYDGVIFADMIKAGILKNLSGSIEIDMQGDSIKFKSNGKKAIDIKGQNIYFYDWNGEGNPVGQLYSTRINRDEKKLGLVLANRKNRSFSISYEDEDNFYSYMRFDKDNSDLSITKVPITFFEETEFRGSQLWFGHDENSIYKSANNNFAFKALNDFVVLDKQTLYNRMCNQRMRTYFADENGKVYFDIKQNSFTFWDGNTAYFFKERDKNSIWCDYGFTVAKNLHVNGNFTVSGNKNCIQSTKNYGDRLFYSVEDCESYLTDRSMELFTVEETEQGIYERKVYLDNIFKECVNIDTDYTVEIIKQGWGDYRLKEQNKNYFIVESDRKDFTFKYVVTAKRKGFEGSRLEKYNKPVSYAEDNEIRGNNRSVNLPI